jgi:site-specific recombinase XerD
LKKTNSTDFAQLVTGFLTDYLPLQRCYSKNTILSYRDSLKLFLRFISEEKGIKLKLFNVKNFNREIIIEFLEWYRQKGATSSAANQRLAAIKTFAEYAQLECIEYISPMQEVTAIRTKKSTAKEVSFFRIDQISQLINKPDVNTHNGLRHRVALTLLYDSGCRVQELCDITIADVFLGNNPTVRLHGKGDKYRTIVISMETSALISSYISRQLSGALREHPLVTNRYHNKMDRDGISYILEKYVTEIRKDDPTFPSHVHCHMLRHSKAMHMLAASINIVYIRDFLGHEDISTTMVYAKTDNLLKNEAINKLAPKVIKEENLPDWNKDKDLMDFLNSFK